MLLRQMCRYRPLFNCLRQVQAPTRQSVLSRTFSDSVTYSGGHASAGQGGFYGSGGSRVVASASHRPEASARAADVAEVAALMEEINDLEEKLVGMGSDVSTESIAIKNEINRKVRNPSVKSLLERLEIKGEPVWGLSVSEREIVKDLKAKYTHG
jgi:hypothetical protein